MLVTAHMYALHFREIDLPRNQQIRNLWTWGKYYKWSVGRV